MAIISGGGGSGAAPALADVLAVGADADDIAVTNVGGMTLSGDIVTNGGDIYADANHNWARVMLQGTSPGTATLNGSDGPAGSPGGSSSLEGGTGDNFTDSGAVVYCAPGNGVGGHGKISVTTNNVTGNAGDALVANGSGFQVFGGIRVAAAVPVVAPTANLPFAYDTTAVTGGFYFWNGAAWVKIATIL